MLRKYFIRLLAGLLFLGAAGQIFAAPLESGYALAPAAAASSAEKTAAYKKARLWLLTAAARYEKTPYLYGGIDRNGMDCSGFVYTSFKDALGITVPRTAAALHSWAEKISTDKLLPGDLVFFKTGSNNAITHVGIYVGGNRFIHSASDGPSTGVIYSGLEEKYWARTYAGAGRALPAADINEPSAPSAAVAKSDTPSKSAPAAKNDASSKSDPAAKNDASSKSAPAAKNDTPSKSTPAAKNDTSNKKSSAKNDVFGKDSGNDVFGKNTDNDVFGKNASTKNNTSNKSAAPKNDASSKNTVTSKGTNEGTSKEEAQEGTSGKTEQKTTVEKPKESKDHLFIGGGLAPSWNLYLPKDTGNSLFGGLAGYFGAGIDTDIFIIPMVFGMELRMEWDNTLNVFRLPITLSWGFNNKLRVFGGAAFSFGNPTISTKTGDRYYKNGSPWFGALGVTYAPFSFKVGPGKLDPYAELAWQAYWKDKDKNSNNDFFAGLAASFRFSTGVRYTWDVWEGSRRR